MKKNLRIKFLIIAGIVLACIYGIIGLPTSKAQLVANWQRNIHLGLDLRGGTYLVLQVQEQDAFNSEANTQADQIRESARKATSIWAKSKSRKPRLSRMRARWRSS